MKRPAFQFYPADWRKDTQLQTCSIEARGLWLEMMCLMHECVPYGHLTVNGQPMEATKLARLVGMGPRECAAALNELEESGVFSKTEWGAIYSRRMVRDEAVRNARAAGGKEGAEHGEKGASFGSKGGRPRKLNGALETPLGENYKGSEKPPLYPPPSSSSSSSSSNTPHSPSSDDEGNEAANGDLLGVSGGIVARPCIPHDAIVAAYHELLPMCPRVAAWSTKRQRMLKARWEDDKERQSIDWWRQFFGWVAQSRFLTGKSMPVPPRTVPFLADIEWLLTEGNFLKVIEGKFNRDTVQEAA